MTSHFVILKNQRNQTNKPIPQEENEINQSVTKRKPVKPRPLTMKVPGQGLWSKKEQTSYIQFLKNNIETMKKSKLRKEKKIFIRMSKFLRTRIAEQCRSHHQKMLQSHGSLDEIIRFFQVQVFPLGSQTQTVQKVEAKTQQKVTAQGLISISLKPFKGLYAINKLGINKFRLQINIDKMGWF